MKTRKRIISFMLGLLMVSGSVTPALNVHATEDSYAEPVGNRVSYYSFENVTQQTGIIQDVKGVRPGTIAESARIVDGEHDGFGKALRVNVPGEGLVLDGQNTLASDWTVTYWVKADTGLSGEIFVLQNQQPATPSDKYAYAGTINCTGGNNNNKFAYHMGMADSQLYSRGDANAMGSWHHIALTRNMESNSLEIYIDGVKPTNGTFSGGTGHANTEILAPYNIIGGERFTGYIDEVRVYGRVLTPEEIGEVKDENSESEEPVEGCVSYYSFDNAESTPVDDLWGDCDGQLLGDIGNAENNYGDYGSALHITTATQGMKVSKDNALTGSWTVSYWVNAANVSSGNIIISTTSDYSTNAGVGAALRRTKDNTGHIGFLGHSQNILTGVSGESFAANQWHHWAFVKKVNESNVIENLAIYIDGKLAWDITPAANAGWKSNDFAAPYDIIGGEGFTGYIDEVKVYNTALTQQQVQGLIGFANYEDLEESISNVQEVRNNEALYTEDSWAAFNTALTAAKNLDRHLLITEQATVDAAVEALNTAFEELTYKGADYVALDIKIAEAEELKKVVYTSDSWEILQDALTAAKAVSRELNITQQETVDAAEAALSAAIEEGLVEELKFSGAYLSLHDDISVHYIFDKKAFEDAGYSDFKLKFTLNGKTTTVENPTWTAVSEEYQECGTHEYVFENIAPQYMNDVITVVITATKDEKQVTSDEITYSVVRYCQNKFEDGEATDELKVLLANLLNYGSEAQKYVEHKVDELAINRLNDDQKALVGSVIDKNMLTSVTGFAGAAQDVQWKSATLRLDNSIMIRYKIEANNISGLYVQAVVGNETKTIPSEEFTKVANETNQYYVYFDGLNAAQMSEAVETTVYNSEGIAVSNTLTYSIESYVKAKYESESVGNIVKAIIKYGKAAEDYNSDN